VTDAQRWHLRRKIPDGYRSPLRELDAVAAKVLYARKFDTTEGIRAFLEARADAHDPLGLADMGAAVERLLRALREGERIVVYGDYDADGVSATALLSSALRDLGAQVRAYIPDRFEESYGLNTPALMRLRDEGAQLVVTVDCGVRSFREVADARAVGLDMIVTDHHSVPRELPPAVAVINPKREDSVYPFRDLAGVGVAYRLMQALADASGAALDPSSYLDLVALGTVADIVPLVEDNRALAIAGLERMRTAPRPGLRALFEKSGVRPGLADGETIAFRLGPRINAAGRLDHAGLAYRLLTAETLDEAQPLAAQLNGLNAERQRLLEEQFQQACSLLPAEPDKLLLVDDPAFHEGIVGLVASRLTETFYRPSLVMRRGDGEASGVAGLTRGSARSIEGFHVTKALEACDDLLLRYGGHARAAGFTLANDNLPAFYERLRAYAQDHLDETTLRPKYMVDAIVTLSEITARTVEDLARLAPFGEGNPDPALATLGLEILELRAIGQEGKHLRLRLREPGGRPISAVAFRMGRLAAHYKVGQQVDIIHRPTLNEWNGERVLELLVSAIRPNQSAQGYPAAPLIHPLPLPIICANTRLRQ